MATDNVSSQVTIGQPHLAKQDLSKLVNITFLWQLVRSRVYDQNGRSLTVLKLMIIFFILLYQDATELNPLTPEVISRQATINIGQYCSCILQTLCDLCKCFTICCFVCFVEVVGMYLFRNNRSCGSWKINSCQSIIRSTGDCIKFIGSLISLSKYVINFYFQTRFIIFIIQ